MVRRVQKPALLLLLLATTAFAHREIPALTRTQQDQSFVPRPDVAKTLALGFDAVLADYYWVQAVLLAGGREDPTGYSRHLGRLIDVVTTLDPWVDHPYRFAAVWLTDTLDDVRQANMLLRRSFAYHPQEWRNRFYLGFNLFFYLDDDAGAADALLEAAELPGSPRYLPRLVARLRSESEDLSAAGLFLEEMVRTAPDDESRAEYQAALDEVQIEWRAQELERAREAYKKLWGEDIESVEQLASGPRAVLHRLPDAEPSSLPVPLRRGSTWEIDPETGRIQSSYYGRRYEVHIDEMSRRQIARKVAADRRRGRGDAPRASEPPPERGPREPGGVRPSSPADRRPGSTQ